MSLEADNYAYRVILFYSPPTDEFIIKDNKINFEAIEKKNTMSEHQEKSTKAKVRGTKLKLATKRHAANNKPRGITKAALTRLGRRAGIPCFGEKSGIFKEARAVVDYYLDRIVRDAVFMTQYARRKTISKKDVLYALSRNNRKLYTIHD
jgi:histone H3/H4